MALCFSSIVTKIDMDGLWFRFNCVSVFSTYSVYSVTLYDSRISSSIGHMDSDPLPFSSHPKIHDYGHNL